MERGLVSSLDREALRILEEILELDDTAARVDRMRQMCGADAFLRSRVEQLLARHESDARLLPTESFVAPRDSLFEIPDRVGPYRVLGEIARGGMGAVVKAERDDGVFLQLVAIKLIRGDIASERAKRRFEEERRILARLRHPAIVRILDGGQQGGQPWLAMDFVDGAPVTEVIRCNKPPESRRLEAFLAICDAVSYAHRHLVVHADIKPSNVLMSPDGSVHLLDFGIARLVSALDGEEAAEPYPLTRGYAAPERAVGVMPTIASDVFSLGVLLVEMLTGRMPDAASRHVPGTHLPAGVLQADVEALAARALAIEPSLRYADAASLQDDVQRLLQHRPLKARAGAGWRYRTGKFIRRHRLGVTAGSVALCMLAGAAVFSTVQWIRANRARVELDARFNEVRSLANYLLFDLYDELGSRPGTVETRVRVAAQAQQYLDHLRAVPHAPTALQLETSAAYRRLAQVLGVSGTSSLGRPQEARAALDRAEMLLLELMQREPRNPAALAQLGWIQSDRWTLLATAGESDRVNASARAYFDAALAIDPGDVSARLGRINTDRCEAYVLVKGADQPGKAREILERALGELRLLTVPQVQRESARLLEYQVLSNLGDAIYYGGDASGSLESYRAALAIAEQELHARTESPAWLSRRGEALWNISGVLEEDPGRLRDALAAVESGIVSLRSVLDLGPDANAEKKLSILYSQQGLLLAEMNQSARALESMRSGMALRESRLAAAPEDGARLRDLVIGRMSFADVLAKVGHRAEACNTARSAVDGWRQIEERSELTAHDRNSNAGQAATAASRYCPRGR